MAKDNKSNEPVQGSGVKGMSFLKRFFEKIKGLFTGLASAVTLLGSTIVLGRKTMGAFMREAQGELDIASSKEEAQRLDKTLKALYKDKNLKQMMENLTADQSKFLYEKIAEHKMDARQALLFAQALPSDYVYEPFSKSSWEEKNPGAAEFVSEEEEEINDSQNPGDRKEEKADEDVQTDTVKPAADKDIELSKAHKEYEWGIRDEESINMLHEFMQKSDAHYWMDADATSLLLSSKENENGTHVPYFTNRQTKDIINEVNELRETDSSKVLGVSDLEDIKRKSDFAKETEENLSELMNESGVPQKQQEKLLEILNNGPLSEVNKRFESISKKLEDINTKKTIDDLPLDLKIGALESDAMAVGDESLDAGEVIIDEKQEINFDELTTANRDYVKGTSPKEQLESAVKNYEVIDNSEYEADEELEQ